jgi:hypothetical protein
MNPKGNSNAPFANRNSKSSTISISTGSAMTNNFCVMYAATGSVGNSSYESISCGISALEHTTALSASSNSTVLKYFGNMLDNFTQIRKTRSEFA